MSEPDVATALDSIERVRTYLKGRIGKLDSDVEHNRSRISETRLDVRELRSDIAAATRLIYELKSEVHGLRIAVSAFEKAK